MEVATSPFFLLVLLGFVVLIGGHTIIMLLVWALSTRQELRITIAYKTKIRSEIIELTELLRLEIRESRHMCRDETQKIIGVLDRDIRDQDKRQRAIQSWVDRQDALQAGGDG